MNSFPNYKFTTSRKLTYNYVHISPTRGSPYILFLHGFPSSLCDWRYQIVYFTNKGYGVIAPDILGHGRTSKPLDVQAYRGKSMAEDIIEILQYKKIDSAIGVGHDWFYITSH